MDGGIRKLYARIFFFFFLQPGSVRDPAGLAGTGLCTGPVPGPVWQLSPVFELCTPSSTGALMRLLAVQYLRYQRNPCVDAVPQGVS